MAFATTTTARPRRIFSGRVGQSSDAAIQQPRAADVRASTGSRRGTSLWIVLGTFATILSVVAAGGLQLRKDHALALEQVERESRSFRFPARWSARRSTARKRRS
jgi:hypothetical protein